MSLLATIVVVIVLVALALGLLGFVMSRAKELDPHTSTPRGRRRGMWRRRRRERPGPSH